jgi:hypothetical protein
MGPDVTDHFAVHTQTFGKDVVALNPAAMRNQAFDGGLVFFPEHGELLEVGTARA